MEPAQPADQEGGRPRSRRHRIRLVALVALPVVLAAAYGLALRGWLLRHLVLDSDEAVVGLMAHQALAGHFSTFYWGQQYGGVEPYVMVPVLWLSHGSPAAVSVTAALLAAVAAALVGLVVAGATGSRWLGAVAGATAWIWPYAVVWNSMREYGFRGACLACGMVALWAAARLHRGRRDLGTCLVLGLALGLGWWAGPELAYLAVPVAVLLVASWDRLFAAGRRLRGPWRPLPVVVGVAGAVVGALPWIYTNAHTGFASLRTGSLPTYDGIGYAGRLEVFFRAMLPVQLGVRTVPGGTWVGGPTVGPVLYGLLAALVVVALARAAVAAARRGRAAAPLLAVAVGVVAFPLLYALVPASGYWVDGRYGVALPPLLVVLLALALAGPRAAPAAAGTGTAPGAPAATGTGAPPAAPADAPPGGAMPPVPDRPRRARHARRAPAGVRGAALAVACAALVGAGVLTAFTAQAGGIPATPAAFARGWGDPEAAVRHVVAELHRHHIRDAYGGYWTAYVLDAMDPDGLTVTPSHLDVVRWPAAAAAVRAAPRPAWLFVAPGHRRGAALAFGNPELGPGNYSEAQFTGLLQARGVPFRVVRLGVLDAVVPSRRVHLPAP